MPFKLSTLNTNCTQSAITHMSTHLLIIEFILCVCIYIFSFSNLTSALQFIVCSSSRITESSTKTSLSKNTINSILLRRPFTHSPTFHHIELTFKKPSSCGNSFVLSLLFWIYSYIIVWMDEKKYTTHERHNHLPSTDIVSQPSREKLRPLIHP